MIARRIDANTVTLSISNLGGALLSFVLTVLIGRALGREGLGAYTVALAWTFPLGLLVDFGLSMLLTRDAASDSAHAHHTMRQVVFQRVTMGGMVVFGLIAASSALSDDPVVQRAIVLAAPMIILLPLFSTFSAIFRARGDMRPVLRLNVGMLSAQVVLTLVVFALGGDVLAALAVNTLTSAGQVAAAWAIWRARFRSPSDVAVDQDWHLFASMARLMRAGLPFALAGIFAALNLRLSLILLEHLIGPEAAGTFAAASRITEAAKLIPNAMYGALLPALVALAANRVELDRVMTRSMVRLGGYGAVVTVVVLVLSPLLLSVIFGDDFGGRSTEGIAGSSTVLIVLSLGLLPGGAEGNSHGPAVCSARGGRRQLDQCSDPGGPGDGRSCTHSGPRRSRRCARAGGRGSFCVAYVGCVVRKRDEARGMRNEEGEKPWDER
ncbi:MAG: oligosaccharide flippase family protein [Chloroflexi bacterium]|nr:oligosaccharide flippase family protein [Chloroflexota bacterium]